MLLKSSIVSKYHDVYATFFQGNFNPFVGAIRQVQMNNKPFELPTRTYEAKTCSATEEGGSFFYADGGHIKLSKWSLLTCHLISQYIFLLYLPKP